MGIAGIARRRHPRRVELADMGGAAPRCRAGARIVPNLGRESRRGSTEHRSGLGFARAGFATFCCAGTVVGRTSRRAASSRRAGSASSALVGCAGRAGPCMGSPRGAALRRAAGACDSDRTVMESARIPGSGRASAGPRHRGLGTTAGGRGFARDRGAILGRSGDAVELHAARTVLELGDCARVGHSED
jgi:hypothetical protein